MSVLETHLGDPGAGGAQPGRSVISDRRRTSINHRVGVETKDHHQMLRHLFGGEGSGSPISTRSRSRTDRETPESVRRRPQRPRGTAGTGPRMLISDIHRPTAESSVAHVVEQSDPVSPSERVDGLRPAIEGRCPNSFTDGEGYWATLLDDIAIGDYDPGSRHICRSERSTVRVPVAAFVVRTPRGLGCPRRAVVALGVTARRLSPVIAPGAEVGVMDVAVQQVT